MATYAVVLVSTAAFLWWLTGSLANRRRAAELVRALRAELPPLGGEASIRWFGTGGFQVDVARPARGLVRFQVVGLLEARDLPLVWLYWRWQGRRDRLVIQADFHRPPHPHALRRSEGPQRNGESRPIPPPVLPGLLELRLQRDPPHLFLSLQVPPGQEAVIGQTLRLVQELASGKVSLLQA